jgi:hypothetical protein
MLQDYFDESTVSSLAKQCAEQWTALPEDHPLHRQAVQQAHWGYRTMERGRIYHVARQHPGENSATRRAKTPIYLRPVAGGGHKYRC